MDKAVSQHSQAAATAHPLSKLPSKTNLVACEEEVGTITSAVLLDGLNHWPAGTDSESSEPSPHSSPRPITHASAMQASVDLGPDAVEDNIGLGSKRCTEEEPVNKSVLGNPQEEDENLGFVTARQVSGSAPQPQAGELPHDDHVDLHMPAQVESKDVVDDIYSTFESVRHNSTSMPSTPATAGGSRIADGREVVDDIYSTFQSVRQASTSSSLTTPTAEAGTRSSDGPQAGGSLHNILQSLSVAAALVPVSRDEEVGPVKAAESSPRLHKKASDDDAGDHGSTSACVTPVAGQCETAELNARSSSQSADNVEDDNVNSNFTTNFDAFASIVDTPIISEHGTCGQNSGPRLPIPDVKDEEDDASSSAFNTARQGSASIPATPVADVGGSEVLDRGSDPSLCGREVDHDIYGMSTTVLLHASCSGDDSDAFGDFASVSGAPACTSQMAADTDTSQHAGRDADFGELKPSSSRQASTSQPTVMSDQTLRRYDSQTEGFGDFESAFDSQASASRSPTEIGSNTTHSVEPRTVRDSAFDADGGVTGPGESCAAVGAESHMLPVGILGEGENGNSSDSGRGDHQAVPTTPVLSIRPAVLEGGQGNVHQEDDKHLGESGLAAETIPSNVSVAQDGLHRTIDIISAAAADYGGDDDDDFGEFSTVHDAPQHGDSAAVNSVLPALGLMAGHVPVATSRAAAQQEQQQEEEDDDFGDFSTPTSIPQPSTFESRTSEQHGAPSAQLLSAGVRPSGTQTGADAAASATLAAPTPIVPASGHVQQPAEVDLLALQGEEFLCTVQMQLGELGLDVGSCAGPDIPAFSLPSSSAVGHQAHHSDDVSSNLQGMDVLDNAGLPFDQGDVSTAAVQPGGLLPPGMHPGMLQWRGSTSEERLLSTLNLTEIAARAHAREAAAIMASTSQPTSLSSSSQPAQSSSFARPALATHTQDPTRIKPGDLSSIRSDNSFTSLSNRVPRGTRVRPAGHQDGTSWESGTVPEGMQTSLIGRLMGCMAEVGKWSGKHEAVQLDEGLMAWALSNEAGDPPAAARVMGSK